MISIFIFAGTSEGREISESLSQKGYSCTVSVATEYGAGLLPKAENLTILQGRLDSRKMTDLFLEKDYSCVIDATHPFATAVSKEIKKACLLSQLPYLRFARATASSAGGEQEAAALSSVFFFQDMETAANWLEKQDGGIFVSTGSKELPLLSQKISRKSRLFVRVLPAEESLKICASCKIPPEHIIAMQGPFSQEQNEAHFARSGAKILLTKESGQRGGYFEKIRAAEKMGMKIAVIQNPESRKSGGGKKESGEKEMSFSSIKEIVAWVEGGMKRGKCP